MFSFEYANGTRILFGVGKTEAIADQIPKDAKVMVTYGGGSIKKNGAYDQVSQSLQDHEWVEFAGIEPNPQYETMKRAVKLARMEKVEFLLAVGGGSVVDATKFLAAAFFCSSDPWKLMTREIEVTNALPMGSVLTLPATGSESNMGFVLSKRETKDKFALQHPLLLPRFAVLDPTFTLTLSPRQVANGVVDAFAHVAEQYLTYPIGAKVQDRYCEGLLLTLIEEGPKALTTPEDLLVRANLMWAANQALNGLIGVGMPQDWATHLIGHELTALYGLDHGQSLAVILPAALREKKDQKLEKLLQYADRVWGIFQGDEDTRVQAAIQQTEHFFQDMNVATRFKDYGLGTAAIDEVVAQLERHGLTAMGEHRDIDLDTTRRILQRAL